MDFYYSHIRFHLLIFRNVIFKYKRVLSCIKPQVDPINRNLHWDWLAICTLYFNWFVPDKVIHSVILYREEYVLNTKFTPYYFFCEVVSYAFYQADCLYHLNVGYHLLNEISIHDKAR